MRRVLAIAALVPLAGCLEELPKPSKVEGLRVLGVQAEPPEVAPGATVELRALVVDTEGRDVKLSWYACQVPERGAGLFEGGAQSGSSGGGGYSLTSTTSCADPALLEAGLARKLGEGESATLEIGADALSEDAIRLAYGLPAGADLPAAALFGLVSVAGVNTTVSLVAEVEGADPLETIKRVNVSLASPPNANPSWLAFDLRSADDPEEPPATGEAPPGECFTAPVAIEEGSWVITALNLPEPPVSYPVLVFGTSPETPFELLSNDETYFYSFFSPEGAFSSSIVKSTQGGRVRWKLDETPEEPVDVWVVVRDGRGGLAWCHSVLSAP